MYKFELGNVAAADRFAEKEGIFFQTSAWGGFKDKYGKEYITASDGDGNTVLSCMLFIIKIKCTPWTIGFANRGPVGDMSNKDLLREWTEFMRGYMKNNRMIYFTADPFYTYKRDFEVTPEGQAAFDNFNAEGYIFNPDKAHSVNRQTNYRILWNNDAPKEDILNGIFAKMEKKLRNDIEIAKARGLEPISFSGDEITEEVFNAFFGLLRQTAELKSFGIRDEDYFRRLFASMKDYITLYFYKYNAATDIAYTENVIADVSAKLEANRAEAADPNTTPQKKERLAPKEKELVKQLNATEERLKVTKEHADAGYLSVYLCIKLGGRAHDFYGANSPLLRELRLTSNYWDMLGGCVDGVCESFDMGGTLRLDTEDIKQDKTYDLYQYKSRYHGVLDELIGEFTLVSNKFLYDIFDKKIHYLRRVLFKN